MGELVRSQKVSYGQLIVPLNVAEETVQAIGELGCVQFVDLNAGELTFNRRYANELKRCDELERKLRYFNEMITREEERADMGGLKFRRGGSADGESTENLELKLESLESELKQSAGDCNATESDLAKIDEGLKVAGNLDSLFESVDGVLGGGLRYVVGVIEKGKYEQVQRLIWRVSRGLVLINSMDLSEGTGQRNFLVVYQGGDLDMKVNKICQSAGVRVYTNIPLDREQRVRFIEEASRNKEQLLSIFAASTKEKRDLLKTIALQLDGWQETVERERQVFYTLNMLTVERGTLRGECWYPSADLDRIVQRLMAINDGNVSPVFSPVRAPEGATIPTYTKTNEFTQTFQDLTDSYGTPRYGEVNTAWLNIVTFPWLFGVMFSDAGHGLFIFLLGLLFIIFAKRLEAQPMNDILRMLFDARWLLLLMGVFAIYCGAIFNEFFGFSIDIFGTSWNKKNESEGTYVRENSDYVYYFGVDPIWKSSNNELYYLNSLKMKLSILIGVFHMTFGIILSFFNHYHEKKYINIFFQWIPEMIFMVCSFGYLCFLIIYKWCTPVQTGAPMLTNVFLEMFQNFGRVTDENHVFTGQEIVEPILLGLVVVSLIGMFIPKPIILYIRLRRQQREVPEAQPLLEGVELMAVDEEASDVVEAPRKKAPVEDNEEGNSLMEIVIFNSIHAIEFILGCISNTASYLRLWALSLAHAQLGAVFLENVFYLQLKMNIFTTIFVGFAVWACITVAILIGMESLSAFLHTLRLHWIEFQNKFYIGDGVPFTPLKLPPLAAAN